LLVIPRFVLDYPNAVLVFDEITHEYLPFVLGVKTRSKDNLDGITPTEVKSIRVITELCLRKLLLGVGEPTLLMLVPDAEDDLIHVRLLCSEREGHYLSRAGAVTSWFVGVDDEFLKWVLVNFRHLVLAEPNGGG
jgi:hypothetical protein